MSFEKFMCQRPKRAYLISTSPIAVVMLGVIVCVNALNGLISFLPVYGVFATRIFHSVSTP